MTTMRDVIRSCQYAEIAGEVTTTEVLDEAAREQPELRAGIAEFRAHLAEGHNYDGETGFCGGCGWDGNA